jgi:chorismate mutase
MNNNPKYYIVEASALPEVFLKVAEAKRLLATGEASTVNEAAKMTDISRSAFYKYRDAVQAFRNMNNSRIITFQFLLRDEPGALSAILATFAQHRANLMSVNSINPSNGCGVVTVAAETSQATVSVDEILHALQQCPGVIKAEILAAG